MITPAQAKDNVKCALKHKVSAAIEVASNNGQQKTQVYLDTDFELVEEVLNELSSLGYKASSDGIKYPFGFALDVSWK